jgi:hypothetical protein
MLNVVMLSVVMLSVVMLNIVMLNVVMLNIVMLSVVALVIIGNSTQFLRHSIDWRHDIEPNDTENNDTYAYAG